MVNQNSLANLRPFSADRQPAPSTRRKPKGKYLTSFLKRCLKKKIDYEDPDTQTVLHGRVRDALVWRLIMNGTQGETDAIKEIFNRIEGKINGGLEGIDFGEGNHIVFANLNTKGQPVGDVIREFTNRLSQKV